MSHQWVTMQVLTPNQDRLARMAQLRRERNARGDTTPYRHAPGCIQALKPNRKEAACPNSHPNKRPSLPNTPKTSTPQPPQSAPATPPGVPDNKQRDC